MVSVTQDVTDYRQAERLLWEIAERLKLELAESNEKDIALKQVLAHIEKEKEAYSREIGDRVERLLTPAIRKLKKDGKLGKTEIKRLEAGSAAIIAETGGETESQMAKLTPREMDICELIKEGLSSKEIADKLGLSPQTIQKHRQLIRRKLQLNHRDINLSSYLRTR